jgi:hypothetical protein
MSKKTKIALLIAGIAAASAAAAFFYLYASPQEEAPATPPNPESTPVPRHAASDKPIGIAAKILEGERRNLQFGPYAWRVLAAEGDKALAIAEYVVEHRIYHGSGEDVTWAASALRKYLNGAFLQQFSGSEQRQILKTKNLNPDNPKHESNGGADTTDRVFLLSIEEAEKYFSGGGDRQSSDWWWLRSPGLTNSHAARVHSDGSIIAEGRNVDDVTGSVRPALWLNLKP